MTTRNSTRYVPGTAIMLDAMMDNPIVAGAAGLTLIAGGCVRMGNALVLILLMVLLLPLVGILSAIERERISPTLRPAFYCAVTAVTVFLFSLMIEGIARGSVENLGIYGPLLAVDSLVLCRTAEDSPYVTPREAFWEALGYAAVFAIIALPAALIREILGNGTLFGGFLGFGGFEALRSPFAGFIICGFALAAYRAVIVHRSNMEQRSSRSAEGGRRQ